MSGKAGEISLNSGAYNLKHRWEHIEDGLRGSEGF